ncbi:MAG: hypothetical protein RJA59_873 [Pseudomonadota bacterium]
MPRREAPPDRAPLRLHSWQRRPAAPFTRRSLSPGGPAPPATRATRARRHNGRPRPAGRPARPPRKETGESPGRPPEPSPTAASRDPRENRARHFEDSGPARRWAPGVAHRHRGRRPDRPRGPEGLREDDDADCDGHDQGRHGCHLFRPHTLRGPVSKHSNHGAKIGREPGRSTGSARRRDPGGSAARPARDPARRGAVAPTPGWPPPPRPASRRGPCPRVVVPFRVRPPGPVATIPERK